MAYMIDARLERGAPSLTLIDSVTGKERLYWRSDSAINVERDWLGLFKRLVLLSCADQLSLVQRTKSPQIGEECLECAVCIDQDSSLPAQDETMFASGYDSDVVSLREWCDKKNRINRVSE